MPRIATLVVCALALITPARGATLYGVRNPGDGGRQLVSVDTATGAVTPISASVSPPLPSTSGAVALDSRGGRAFFTGTPSSETDSRIYTVSAQTGAILNSPAIAGSASQPVLGMEYDDYEGVLYVVRNPGDGGRQVASLNPATGVVTAISASISPPLPSSSGVETLDPFGNRFFFIATPTGATDSRIYSVSTATGAVLSSPVITGRGSAFFVALAWDGPDATLYGVRNPGDGGRQVVKLNPATGAVTAVSASISPPLPSSSGVAAVDATGNRFSFTGTPDGETVERLFTVDTTTGTVLNNPVLPATGFFVGLIHPPPALAKADLNTDYKADGVWRHAGSGSMVSWLMNGVTVAASPGLPGVTNTAWKIAGVGDFQGDGKPDILWRNTTTGDNSLWLMDGTTVAVSVSLTSVPDTNWNVAAVGDFQGDGKADILWRHATAGTNSVWLMNGPNLPVTASLPTVADVNWKIAGTGDFQGDGKSDLVWRHSLTGDNSLWLMNGTTVAVGASLTSVIDVNWRIAGVGDIQADGKSDLIWRHATSGNNSVWMMNGTTIAVSASLPAVANTNWKIAMVGDFQGDGKADLLWRNTTTGDDSVWLLNGPAVAVTAALPAVLDTQWEIVP
ncbi:MAG: FG-GAP-like repeat-containing protein [Thermoanaerobaculia bacterium]